MSRDTPISTTEARQALAQQQAQLVRALKTGEAGARFDDARLSTAAESLLNKRTRSIEKMWPTVAELMNGDVNRRVREYAHEHPFAPDGPEDGFRFARWLLCRHDISDDIRIAALVGLTQQGFPVRVSHLYLSRGLVMAWRSPWGRVRVLRFRR